jgi:hypothetical protein
MRNTTCQTREHRTMTVNFQNEATDYQLSVAAGFGIWAPPRRPGRRPLPRPIRCSNAPHPSRSQRSESEAS